MCGGTLTFACTASKGVERESEREMILWKIFEYHCVWYSLTKLKFLHCLESSPRFQKCTADHQQLGKCTCDWSCKGLLSNLHHAGVKHTSSLYLVHINPMLSLSQAHVKPTGNPLRYHIEPSLNASWAHIKPAWSQLWAHVNSRLCRCLTNKKTVT